MGRLCVYCKGPHAQESCPLYLKAQSFMRAQNFKAKDFSGNAPAPFVGHYGYPSVNVGILAPPGVQDASNYDAPHDWATQNYGIADVAQLRGSMVNSRFSMHIKRPHQYLETAQDVAMASKPVDVDISLKDVPSSRLRFDTHAAPMGPSASLTEVELTSNPNIHTRVQRAYDSTDLLAKNAVVDLYEHNFDETFLMRMLSVGTLGLEENRKLVPTRWSITATDDMLGKHVLEEVKDKALLNHQAYFGNYLGNYYLILCFPQPFSYELFEMSVRGGQHADWSGHGRWSTDYEDVFGRKEYASQTAGGYYTVRLAIAEQFREMKRQAGVLVLRFITDDYTMPLGVWVTREATRKAMQSKPILFADEKLMLTYAKHLAKNKFGFDLDKLIPESKLLKNRKEQKMLLAF
jgi:hypothetical protein